MKKNKRANIKRIAAGGLALFIAIIMVVGMLSPFFTYGATVETQNAPPNVTIGGVIGMDRKYKVGNTTPIRLELENKGGNFKGKVELKLDTSEDATMHRYQIYSKQVELPAGAFKVVEMEVPISTLKFFQTVDLVDAKGKVITTKKISTTALNPEKHLIGILTDNKDGLNYIKGLEIDSLTGVEQSTRKLSASSVIFLDENTLPITKKVLDNFNMIIIDNFDTSKISAGQKKSLQEWLATGGVLTIGTGENVDKVFKGIDKTFVDFQNVGNVTLNELNVVDGANAALKDTKSFSIKKIEVENAQVLNDEAGNNLTSTFANGQGIVIVHPFALSEAPFSDMNGKERFLENIYQQPLEERTYAKVNQNYNQQNYNVNNLPSLNEGKLYMIFGIVVVYAFFIGPILYFILKKLDKREKGFVIIPAFAIVVTIGITIISSDTAYKKPIINSISTVALTNKSGEANMSVSSGVFSPSKGKVKVSFDNSVPLFVTDNNYYYGMMRPSRSNDTATELEFSDNTQLTFFDVASWNMNMYSYEKQITLNEGFECDFYIDGGKLKGTVKNNTGRDFPEVILGIKNSLKKYDNVKNGDTIEISQDATVDDQYFDIYQAFRNIYGDPYDPLNTGTSEEKRQTMLKQNIASQASQMNMKMGYSGGYSSYSSSARPVAVGVIGSSFTTSVPQVPIGSNEISQKLIEVDFYCFNYDKLDETQVKVNGKTANEYNLNFVTMKVPLDLTKMKTFDFGYGLIGISDIQTAIPYDYYNENDFYLRGSGEVEFTFNVIKGATIDEFQINWDIASYSGTPTTEKEILNTSTQEWEILSTTKYAENASNYINSDGNITIRVGVQSEGNIPTPKIRIKGGQK